MSHYRALLAFDAGELSPQAHAFVSRKLETNAVWRTELAEIRTLEDLSFLARELAEERASTPRLRLVKTGEQQQHEAEVSALRALIAEVRSLTTPESGITLPAVTTSLVEKAPLPVTETPQTRRAPRRSLVRPILLATLAAAAGFALWSFRPSPKPSVAHRPSVTEEEPLPVDERTLLHPALTYLAGTALHGAANGTPLNVGDTVDASDLVWVRGEAHFLVSDSTGMALQGDAAELRFAKLWDNEVELELAQGAIKSRVKSGSHFVVASGGYRFAVRGTNFEVQTSGADTSLFVSEGHVEVFRGEERIGSVRAPGSWHSGQVLTAKLSTRSIRVELATLSDPIFSLEAGRFDGLSFAAGDVLDTTQGLHMRIPLGSYDVTTFQGGIPRRQRIEVLPDSAVFERTIAQAGPTLATEPFDPSQLTRLVQSRIRPLRTCYELVQRQEQDALRDHVTVRIAIAADGRVRDVQMTGRDNNTAELLLPCFRREITRWSFPPPEGGALTVDLPIRLTSR